ncbi:Glutathione S-transferase domain protein, partial [Sinorhizobium meliloti CCNWSX0020]
MLRLYDSRFSGNSWKVRILLNQLRRPFERITLDLDAGETKTDSFIELNRFARIPVLQLSDKRTIVESAAILLY